MTGSSLPASRRIAVYIVAIFLMALSPPTIGEDETVTIGRHVEHRQLASSDSNKRPSALAGVSACDIQDGRRLPRVRFQAVGTEPFWAAKVEGRCVTYTTPDNQKGTRIWTRLKRGSNSFTWAGTLHGRSFGLSLMRASVRGCSDGMSDTSYDWVATTRVKGKQERGCADIPRRQQN
jgi:uncharacterized membrane protein